MDKRELRVGDFVKDPAQNYTMRVGVEEIACAELFEGLPLTRGFFDKNGFRVDTTIGKEVLYKQDGEILVMAEDNGAGKWFVRVRHGTTTFSGEIFTVHHYQHILSDTRVYWKITL